LPVSRFASWPVYRLTVNGITGKLANRPTLFSPACLGHAGNFAIEREIAEAKAAQAKPAINRALAATLQAAIVFARRKFRRPLLFFP